MVSRIDFCDVLGPSKQLLDMFCPDPKQASGDFTDPNKPPL